MNMHIVLLLGVYLSADLQFSVELKHITGLASAAAPEIHAAALLRISDSSKLTAVQKQELIERAFTLAAQAKEAYPRLPIYGAAPDTADAYRNAASSLRLDRLSLQTRAIQKAIGISDKLTRELTERIERPHPGKLACEAGAIPDLQDYFEMVRDVDTQIASAESLLELAALAKSIGSEAQAEAFAARLQTVPPDSRAFAATWEAMQAQLTQIRGRFPSQGVNEGIRKYLLDNLNGPRCADAGHVFQSARAMVDWYNSAADSGQLKESDLKPAKMEGRIKTELYWESEDSQALMEGLRKLRFSPKSVPYTVEERKQDQWKQALDDFMGKLRSANPGFHQTTALLQALIEFTPPGQERDRLFAAYMEALRTSNLQQESPAEWLWRADSLYRMLQQDPDAPKVMAAFRNSNVPPLALYAWFVDKMGSNGMF